MVRNARRLAVLMSALVVLAACGKETPTSPSGGGATTRIIGVSGSLSFGGVQVGSSASQTFTISNSGNAALTFTGLTVSGGIVSHFAATPTSGSVPAGGNVVVTVRFTPQSGGTFSGTLSVTADQTSGTNSLPISGTGVTPPVTLVSVVTDANTRAPVGGIAVQVSAGGQTVGTASTDGNGYFSIVVPSSTALTVNLTRSGYNAASFTATLTADTRRDATIVPLWRVTGRGNTVFDMPTYVQRVRIIGVWDGRDTSNFIVRVAGRGVVNEILRTTGRYEGLHLVSGGVVEIVSSNNIDWEFRQEQ
jgi:hypothetical protein